MTKTMEALEKFAQALPPTMPQGPSHLRAADASLGSSGPQSRDAAVTSPPVAGAEEDPDSLLSGHAAFGWSELLRTAAPHDPVSPAKGSDARLASNPEPSFDLPSTARTGAIKAEPAGDRQPAVTRSQGTTRRGSQSEWHRLIGLAVLVVTIGIGFKLLVQASERAGEAHWRQKIGKSLAPSHHPGARSRSAHAP